MDCQLRDFLIDCATPVLTTEVRLILLPTDQIGTFVNGQLLQAMKAGLIGRNLQKSAIGTTVVLEDLGSIRFNRR
jgi:hypothetical protein